MDAKQKGGETNVGEVDLGRLDHPLLHVLEKRGQLEHHVGGLENGNPVSDRRGGSAHVVAQRGKVDDLSHPAGQQGQEFLKQRQIAQLNQGADIPLDVGLEVAVEKPAGFQALFVEPGEKTAADQIEGLTWRIVTADFTKGKRPKGQHGRPARQRLTDRLVELRLMAAGQDEQPAFSGFVDHALDIGEQNGKPLHFVQYATSFHLCEEATRVGLGRHADVRIFQGKIWSVGERHPGQGGLARLPRPEDGHHGILGGGSQQFLGDVSSDHNLILRLFRANRKLKFLFAQILFWASTGLQEIVAALSHCILGDPFTGPSRLESSMKPPCFSRRFKIGLMCILSGQPREFFLKRFSRLGTAKCTL